MNEERFLSTQDCLLMKFEGDDNTEQPIHVFRGKWAEGLEQMYQCIEDEIGWEHFHSFVSSDIDDNNPKIEHVKHLLNQVKIERTKLIDVDFGNKGSIRIYQDFAELQTDEFRYFLCFENNIQSMDAIDRVGE